MNRKDLKDYKYNQEWIKEQMEYIEELNSTINRLTTTLSDMPKGSKSIYDIEAEKIANLQDKLKEVSKILKEEEKTPMYNRNSYKGIRDIKNIVKGGSYENK